jgi:hypothetical protein
MPARFIAMVPSNRTAAADSDRSTRTFRSAGLGLPAPRPSLLQPPKRAVPHSMAVVAFTRMAIRPPFLG